MMKRAQWESLGVCVFYGSVSTSITLVNKLIFTTYNFPCVFIVMAAQMITALLWCHASKALLGADNVPSVSWSSVASFAPVGAINIVNVAVGFLGVGLVSIPLFLCLRRTTTAFVLVFEYFILRSVPAYDVKVGVGLIVLGSVVAGLGSLDANLLGYIFIFTNNALTAVYLAVMKKVSGDTGIKGIQIVYLNSAFCLPVVAAISLYKGEVNTLSSFLTEHGVLFALSFGASACLGVVLNYAAVLCTTKNSPQATSVTGNAKDVVLTVLGAIIFRDFTPTLLSVSGVVLSMAGAAWYSVAKLKENSPGGESASGADPDPHDEELALVDHADPDDSGGDVADGEDVTRDGEDAV